MGTPKVTDLFTAIPLSSGIFLDAHFTAPWCISARVEPEDYSGVAPTPDSIIAFHYIYEGQLTLKANNQCSTLLKPGEIAILPRNETHVLSSDCDLEPVLADGLIQAGSDGAPATIRHGGGGDTTRLVCGFLGCGRRSDPLLTLLPTVMTVSLPDPIAANWFDSSFKLAAKEKIFNQREAVNKLAKLAELLFLDALRHYVRSQPENSLAWLEGLSDPKILRALSRLQSNLGRRWTTAELASEAGMSRSAFAARFVELMGAPPMRYLTIQRLQSASMRLRETRDSLAEIAFDIGYESEAAFNRAFKKAYGLPPATWRHYQPDNIHRR